MSSAATRIATLTVLTLALMIVGPFRESTGNAGIDFQPCGQYGAGAICALAYKVYGGCTAENYDYWGENTCLRAKMLDDECRQVYRFTDDRVCARTAFDLLSCVATGLAPNTTCTMLGQLYLECLSEPVNDASACAREREFIMFCLQGLVDDEKCRTALGQS